MVITPTRAPSVMPIVFARGNTLHGTLSDADGPTSTASQSAPAVSRSEFVAVIAIQLAAPSSSIGTIW